LEFPVRCFTCGTVLAHLFEQYKEGLAAKKSAEEVLDGMGIRRYCCRRMFLSHVDVVSNLVKYSRV